MIAIIGPTGGAALICPTWAGARSATTLSRPPTGECIRYAVWGCVTVRPEPAMRSEIGGRGSEFDFHFAPNLVGVRGTLALGRF